MLNQDFSNPRNSKWPQLSLKRATRRNHLTRLLPCGSLEQRRNGITCAVFLKRTRTSSNLLPLLPLPKQKLKDEALERTRGRRGSFLRLARIPQSLSVRG